MTDCYAIPVPGARCAVRFDKFAAAAILGGITVPPVSRVLFMEAIIAILLLLAFYILPAAIANKRDHPNHTAILILNIFLGWTFIGWVISLVWALMGPNYRKLSEMPPQHLSKGGLDWHPDETRRQFEARTAQRRLDDTSQNERLQ